jgi:hypothetical protein
MFTGSAKELTDLARVFTVPANATHRQYEALRAYFVEGLSGAEVARRFGYEHAKSRHLFRDFVDATAAVTITGSEIQVRYHKRAHNPLLVAARFSGADAVIPWLGGKRLRLFFG